MKRHISILTFLLCAFAAVGTAFSDTILLFSNYESTFIDCVGTTSESVESLPTTPKSWSISAGYSIAASEMSGYRFAGWYTRKSGWEGDASADTVDSEAFVSSREISYDQIQKAGTSSKSKLHTIVAKYIKLHTLTIAINPDGSGTVSTNGVGVKEVIVEDGGSVTLKATANAGWKFEKWSDGVTSNPRLVSKVSADATYTAVFKAQFKTVTLEKCGGTGGTDSVVVTNGMAMPKITVPTRTGYDFKGYFTSESGDQGVQYYLANGTSAKSWSEDEEATALFARWDGKKFKLEFNDQGADKKAGQGTKDVVYGENPGPVATPTKSNYTFIGYFYNDVRYWDENGTWSGGVWTASDRTVEIFARYRADSYTIKFNRNGGTEGSYTDLTKDVDEQFALPDGKALSYERHAFAGWALSEGGEKKFDGGATTKVADNISSEPPNPKVLTFYAVWTDLSRTVRFNAGSAEATVIPQTKLVTAGEPFGELATATWPGERCTLAGWWNKAGEEITADSIVPESAGIIDLTARWTTNGYTVVFHENGGTGEMGDQKVPFYETVSLVSNRFVRAGYHFIGWATNETDVVTYADGAEVRDLVSTKDEKANLYAKWAANDYQVGFFGNGGTNEMAVQSFTYDVEQALMSNRFVREGFVFAGWATDPTNDVAYGDGAKVLNLTTKKDATVRLFAKWTAKSGEISKWSKALGCDNLDIEPTEEEGIAVAVSGTGVRIDIKKTKGQGVERGLEMRIGDPGTLTVGYSTEICETPRDSIGYEKPEWASFFKLVSQDVIFGVSNSIPSATWKYSKDDVKIELIRLLLQTRNEDIGEDSDSDNDYAQVLSVRWEPAVTNASWVGVTFRTNDGTMAPEDIYTNVTCQAGEAYGELPVLADKESGAQFLGWVQSAGASSFISPDWIVPADSEGTQLHAVWSVVTNAVPAAIAGLVYDGAAKTGVAAGANYTIVGNVATNAGDYTATATVTNGVWEGGAKGATNIAWTIAKATVDMSGVTFASATYVFDGKEHSIAVTGVPVGVEVFYTGDATNRTEVGTNTVTASFKVLDELNYNAITTQMTATLAITAKEEPPTPPEPVVTNAVPTAIAGLVYDGTAKTGVAAGANYTIVGNVATNAGDYMATATVTNGVWEGGAKGATNVAWTIAKATYDMTGVTFTNGTYGADGTAKSIFVSGALPPGATVAYEGNGQTEPGSYTVTAKFTGDAANYEAIPDMTATLTIMPAGLVRFETPTLVTTGGSNLVVVIWGGVTGMVSSVQLQAVYNTASAADLDLKKAKVDGTVQPSFKFPYTLKWREGELGARVVEIPVVKNKTTESDEFLTLQLGSPKNVRISGTDGGTENGGVCTVTIRGPKGPATGKWYARAVANDAMRGSVSGSKLCKKGATVTFKASARAGSAFVGWKTNDVLVTTAASWSFKMPTHGVEAVGTFVPQGEDYLRLGEIVLPSQLKAGASVTLGLPMPESLSRATVKVTGLPSGLSYDSKRNAITGKPKKASSKAATVAITVTNLAGYRIVRKYQVQVVKTVTSTDPAKLVSESAPCGAVTVAVNDELWGKVTGMGVYAAGAKVTLKATASAGYVFTGWETNGVAAVSRKASWSFTMPAEAVVAKAIFRPIAEDYLEFARDFLPAELQLNVSTNVVVPAAESLSQPTVTISGLPSGLSYSSSSGSIGGKPKKTGAKTVTVTVSNLSGFKIVRKYKVTVVKGTPKAGFASLTSESKPYFALTAVPDDVLAGTTSGTGVRQEGTKVTVKATALAGYVFGGWYEGDDRLTQKASYSFTMPGREMKLVAGFVTKAEDAASVGATVGGLGFGAIGGERMTVETNVYCGIRVDWPVVASAASLPSVKVTGLPSGLSYKSGKISGVPTVVSKAGKPSTVKVAVTTAGKASKTFSIVLTVEDREPWARGTYTGPYVAEGLTNGTMTLTVAKNGKISGKIVRKVSGKTKTTTLSATSIASRVQDNDGVFYGLEPSYKSGTKAIKMPFVLQLDPGGSGLGIAASEEVTLCQRE